MKGLIAKPERKENGYRVFTDPHIRQIRLVRTAFQIEVLQNGLRKKIVEMVKTAARGDFDGAIRLTRDYLIQIQKERINAEYAAGLINDKWDRQLLIGCNKIRITIFHLWGSNQRE